MKNKFLILALIFLFVALASTANARELKNDFYQTMPPDSYRCFSVRLTSDIFIYEEDRATINVTTDAETNIKFINVSASPDNPVVVPICFFSFGKKEGDFFNYTITLDSEKSSPEKISGGFCISNRTGAVYGRPEKNVCDFIIRNENLFDIHFQYGDEMPIKKDTETKVPLWAYSPNNIDLELTVNSSADINPKTYLLKLGAGNRTPFEFSVPALGKGNYEINLTAQAVLNGKYCNSEKVPFCKKEISSTLMVDTLGLKGWYFYVAPLSYSAFDSKTIQYIAVIENYENGRNFDLELKLPEGLASDFSRSTVFVESQEKKEIPINITPSGTAPSSYEIDFVATGDEEKTSKSYLYVRETEAKINDYWSDIKNTVPIDLRPAIEYQIKNFLDDYRQNGLDTEEYASLLDLLQKAQKGENVSSQIRVTQAPSAPATRSDSINPILIVATMAVVIAIVFVVFYSTRKRSSEEDEKERYY